MASQASITEKESAKRAMAGKKHASLEILLKGNPASQPFHTHTYSVEEDQNEQDEEDIEPPNAPDVEENEEVAYLRRHTN